MYVRLLAIYGDNSDIMHRIGIQISKDLETGK